MKKHVVFFILALLALVSFQVFPVPPAHAASFGDPHNCDALAQGATYWPGDSPGLSPFHAYQIPNSPTYNWGSNSIVACQEANPNDSGFNNANWDGYGNPFQCVELIDRYNYLRYGSTDGNYQWGNAGSDWTNHPWHYVQHANGDVYAPAMGDILIWNNTSLGHIAIIIAINARVHKVTVMEQNFLYNGWHFGAERVFYYTYDNANQYAYISGSYTAYTQSGSTFTGTDADPVGWLHSTI